VFFVFLSAYFAISWLPGHHVVAAVFLGVEFSIEIPVGFLEFLALTVYQCIAGAL